MIAGSWLLRRVVRQEYISYCSALPHACRYVHFVCDLTLNWHYQCNTSVTNVCCVVLLLPLVKYHLRQGERLPHSKNSHIDPYDYWITIIVGNIVASMTSISVVSFTVLAMLQFVFRLNDCILAWCLQIWLQNCLFLNPVCIYYVWCIVFSDYFLNKYCLE